MSNDRLPPGDAIFLKEHPWISLESVPDVEAWIDLQHRELQQVVDSRHATGQGICLTFLHGGELYVHTNPDGDVLLDLTEEAQWVAPVLSAVTGNPAPRGQIWYLPGNVLIPLVLGLNSLIASSRLVRQHVYKGAR